MLFKRGIRQIHLWLGLSSGLVIFIVAVTGCLNAFDEEFRNTIYKNILFVNEVSQPAKPVSELINVAKGKFPEQEIKSIRVKANPKSSVEITFKNKEIICIDPYTKKILGTYNKDKDFFGTVLKIHRNLYIGEPGKLITGISALIFTLMLISGMILWWPANKQLLKQKFSIKKNAHWKKLNYDLHSVLGFYASWIIIFTALTGLIWSFKWAEHTMYWLSGSKKEERKQYASEYFNSSSEVKIDSLIASFPTEKVKEYFINMPEDSAGVIRAFVRYEKEGFFRKQDQFFFDRYSGKLIKEQLFVKSSAGDKIKSNNLDLHTGKVFGLAGRLLVFFASLIVASLPVTGFLLWRGKRK